MHKKILTIIAILSTATFMFAGGKKDVQKKQPKQEIIISAAASLTNAMNDCISSFEKENPSITVTPTYGSSGSLRKQIEQGAPSDLFFSASQKHMKALMDENLINNDTKTDLLKNEVVLIVPKDSSDGITSFNDAATDKIKQLAIGEPSSVPAGSYAKDVFTTLGLYEGLESAGKLVFGKDVRQVLAYVEQGNVQAGVVYSTDAAISDSVTVIADAPEGSHKAIVYPVAILKNTKKTDTATKYLTFLKSKEAMDIFAKYGFKSAK